MKFGECSKSGDKGIPGSLSYGTEAGGQDNNASEINGRNRKRLRNAR